MATIKPETGISRLSCGAATGAGRTMVLVGQREPKLVSRPIKTSKRLNQIIPSSVNL